MPSKHESPSESAESAAAPPAPSLADLRHRIDAIDAQIIDLLSQRARTVQEVGHLKHRAGAAGPQGAVTAPIFVPERERQIFERLRTLNPGPLPDSALAAVYREILSASRALEAPISVAYLGPPGTFSHRAALSKFGSSSELKPADTIPDVFATVERGAALYGIVPVENSTEGVVNNTLDRFLKTSLKICAEVYVSVDHNLASRAASLRDIRRLYAHPQAFAQSRNWLRENLPKVEVVDTTSNSKSAQMAALDSESAAITTDIAADLHGLSLLAAHIEDSAQNRTRFLVIGQNEPKPSGSDKTSLYFLLPHRTGALLRAMAAFSAYGINLTMIESRPVQDSPGEYTFFIDIDGHSHQSETANAIRMLRAEAISVKELGSYPKAE